MKTADEPILRTKAIFFEPFLRALQRELGYAIDIGKYKQLTAWVNDPAWLSEPLPLKRLYGVCRLLFLQNTDHQTRFDELFATFLWEQLSVEAAQMEAQQKKAPSSEKDARTTVTNVTVHEGDGGPLPPVFLDMDLDPEPPDDALQTEQQTILYLNLTIPTIDETNPPPAPSTSLGNSSFVLTDAYLPLNTREMIQGWRYLRKRGETVKGSRLDVEATVRHIAREGTLIAPVFQAEKVNSDGILLILADRRGSMAPFHRLTDKLIDTARKEGGHRNAHVYYFYNCPVGHVYKNPNLTDPVPLLELYAKIHPDQTNALIIGDAGAVRGNYNERRIQMTKTFLFGGGGDNNATPGLQKAALFVCWLNPMPQHRWLNSSAAALAYDPKNPIAMYSLMDEKYDGFFRSIKYLMGK